MGAIVTVNEDIEYLFDAASDGVEFKKDIEKLWKKDGIKGKITIKKSKDVKPKTKPKRKYYGSDTW